MTKRRMASPVDPGDANESPMPASTSGGQGATPGPEKSTGKTTDTKAESDDPKPKPPAKSTDPPKTQPGNTDPTQPKSAKSKPKTLYQELVVWRRPTFGVSGITISQDLKYRVLSKLHTKKNDDGTLDVKQEVYETKLEKADGLSQAVFADSLKRMQGEAFTYSVDTKGEIIKFTGPKSRQQDVPVDGLGGQAFLATSVMDDDGWREMAQLSFLLPEKPLKTLRKGMRWERKMAHDWGDLGSWYGKTTYTHAGTKDSLHRVDYLHRMSYVPPGKGKKQKKSPLQITAANFKPVQTNGQVYYHADQGRVSHAQEWFHVRGVVTTMVLGQATQAQVEERQHFAIRIVDTLPSANAERGASAPR